MKRLAPLSIAAIQQPFFFTGGLLLHLIPILLLPIRLVPMQQCRGGGVAGPSRLREADMRLLLAGALILTALAAPAALQQAAAHGRGPWCVIDNDGTATWICYPTHVLCHRFGEAPGTGLYCVQNPAWNGGG